VLLALILLFSKFKDNASASVATGCNSRMIR
jgi:hypothetical protein